MQLMFRAQHQGAGAVKEEVCLLSGNQPRGFQKEVIGITAAVLRQRRLDIRRKLGLALHGLTVPAEIAQAHCPFVTGLQDHSGARSAACGSAAQLIIEQRAIRMDFARRLEMLQDRLQVCSLIWTELGR